MANEPITDEELQLWADTFENRWQIRTWSADNNSWLSTVELPQFASFSISVGSQMKYESCFFKDGNLHGSAVLLQYMTKEEAIRGHNDLLEQLNLVDGPTVEYDSEDGK